MFHTWIYSTPCALSYNEIQTQQNSTAMQFWLFCQYLANKTLIILIKIKPTTLWCWNPETGPLVSQAPQKFICFPPTSSKPLSSFLNAAKRRKKERIRHCLYWHVLKNEQNKMSNGKDEARTQPSDCASICQECILCSLKRRGSWFDLSWRGAH